MRGKYFWWLNQEVIPLRWEAITSETVRFSLAHFGTDTKEGRWEEGRPNTSGAACPSTVDTYFRCVRAFFNFVVREGLLGESL